MQIHKSKILVIPAPTSISEWAEFAPAGEPAGWVAGLFAPEDLPQGAVQRVSFWKHDGGSLSYEPPLAELVVLLQGCVRLMDTDGSIWDIHSGQVALIPAGFRGTWITREPVVKVSLVFAQS